MQTQTTISAPTASKAFPAAAIPPLGVAITGGFLTAMAWDPWRVAVAAILGLSLWWVSIITAKSARQAFGYSAVFGMVWLALACAWMHVFGPIPYAALVVIEGAVVGLVGAMAWGWRSTRWRWVMVPASWVAIEAARVAFPFGGFSWAQLSHSQATGDWMLGYLPWVGSWGMSAMIVLLGMGIAHGLSQRTNLVYLGVSLGAVVLGGVVLQLFPAPFTTPEGNSLRTAYVQSGDVRHTFAAGISALNPKNQRVVDALTKEHAALTGVDLDLIIWPENSLDSDPDATGNEWLAVARDRLLATVGRATVFAGQNDHNAKGELTNAIGVYQQGKRTDTITKHKLVPFGEFFPYPELLGWVPSAQLIGHMVPGEGPGAVRVQGQLVGAVICYESAFSTMIDQALANDAGVLVVSTNNASFGDSAMMLQHLSISRLRAVEYGRPVVHASLSGPSAFIGPDGTMATPTTYLEGAARIQTLQPRSGFTPAAWLNPVFPWVAVGVLVIGWGARWAGNRRSAQGA